MTTIRIQLFGSHDNLLDTHDIRIEGHIQDDIDAAISSAVSKLVLHTWTLAVGDCIRINKV